MDQGQVTSITSLASKMPSVFCDVVAFNLVEINCVCSTYQRTYSYLVLYRGVYDFELLEGDLHGLADTAEFLRTLTRLDEEGDVRASDLAEQPQQRERLAAGGLFRWEVNWFTFVNM